MASSLRCSLKRTCGGKSGFPRCFSMQTAAESPSLAQGMKIKREVSQLIGRTPLMFLKKVTEGCGALVAVKQEMMQPTATIKDRPAFVMINVAEKKNLISPGKTTLIEPTSGNMGINMTFMAAMKRSNKGHCWDLKKAYELLESAPNAFMLNQFSNPANTQTTSPEIWEDTNGQVDIFIMGIDSGGTVSGVGQYLKSQNPNVMIYGLEPAENTILSGGLHHITGNGVGFKPNILDMDVMEEVLMVGISSGANTVAALRLARRPENKGKFIVVPVLFQELRKQAEKMQLVSVD